MLHMFMFCSPQVEDVCTENRQCFCVCSQALEEAAANAAEEERRRLQTQTELQDRYRMDLEREKMVHLFSPSFTESLCQNILWR